MRVHRRASANRSRPCSGASAESGYAGGAAAASAEGATSAGVGVPGCGMAATPDEDERRGFFLALAGADPAVW